MSEFLGIARERVFSPGKVEADRAILDAVAGELRRRGHRVHVVSADERLPTPSRATTVFTMSQGELALATLRRWEMAGVRVVNSVDAILNCHRHRMIERLASAGVAAPETILLDPARVDAWPPWLVTDGGWIKRGDVHATESDDVVFVRDQAAAILVLARFQSRGIARAVLQRHVAGSVIKFYATRGGFLAWFPAADGALDLSADQARALRRLAQAGARALGLDIYGGDCVADVNGGLQLIDLNDWPSYARCRSAAAGAIAAYLET
ncbi:MAG TPA: hypothetical protein VL403_17705 [Candidatus Kryptonia bacterium]|nr:hypothetical protein [Candidatus Kryptonia bacterium]